VTTFNYARPLASANRLIAKFGQLGAIRRAGEPTGPDYDPTPGVDVDHDAHMAVLDYDSRDVDGTRILATDKYVLVAVGTLPIEIGLSDKVVEADGTVYSIVPPLKPLSPAGTVVLYEIQARR